MSAAILSGAALYNLSSFFYFRPGPLINRQAVHLYNDPGVDIAGIRIKAFYAVPRDGEAKADWKNYLDGALAELRDFHAVQFRGKSVVNYEVFPEPVILAEESRFYNEKYLNESELGELVAIAEEIERRVFLPGGDIYDEEFADFEKGEYPVLALLYEGSVAATGGVLFESGAETAEEAARTLGVPSSWVIKTDVEAIDGFFLVSSDYFTDPLKKPTAETVFYHEFGHTLGMGHQYQDDGSVPRTAEGVMGLGISRPLETNYLDRHFLIRMGVIE